MRATLLGVQALVVLLGIALAASQFGGLHAALDNLSNFPVHFAAAFLVCAAILAIARRGRWAFIAAAGLAVSLVPVVPWYFSSDKEAADGGDGGAKLLVSNVYFRNRHYEKLARLIDVERPDVIGLVEVDTKWLDNLPALRNAYPFRFEAPHDASSGLAVLSRFPLRDSRIERFGEEALPAIVTTLQIPGGEVELILAHPPPPIDADFAGRRDAELRTIARYVRASTKPLLLAGDLNVTMWNRNYRALVKAGGLHNARAGRGIGPTWPAVAILGIPIDHIMATPPVHFRSFEVHQGIGSDHRPISAEFGLHACLRAGGNAC